jgi:hypothetical protein
LPVPGGTDQPLTLTLVNLDVDVFSPQAVSVQRSIAGTNTVATLVLSPNGAWVQLAAAQPRREKSEKPVFYAEISQLYVPSAGVIEGSHQVSIRPAQGELSELIFNVPAGATITDVSDGSSRHESAQTPQEIDQSNPAIAWFRSGVSIPTRASCA